MSCLKLPVHQERYGEQNDGCQLKRNTKLHQFLGMFCIKPPRAQHRNDSDDQHHQRSGDGENDQPRYALMHGRHYTPGSEDSNRARHWFYRKF
jgi:hypothetical protein